MKGIKLMIAAALLAVATSASAQFVNASTLKNGTKEKVATSTTYDQHYVNEISIYLQDGWGIGYQGRMEMNKYYAINSFGASYMSGFSDNTPDIAGQINLRCIGVRFNTPYFGGCRLYTDLTLGYTMTYINIKKFDISQHFGLDFGVGIQLGKHCALGYNLDFIAPGEAKSHWGKISFLF